MPVDLAIPDPLHPLVQDDGGIDAGGVLDVAAVVEPDQLPEDQIEHASDGVGVSFEDRGGLSDAWNRLN